MGLFSQVCMCCNMCGKPFLTDFSRYDGRFCRNECHAEYKLRRAIAIMGDIVPLKQQPYTYEEYKEYTSDDK